jgi:hypothetical protein
VYTLRRGVSSDLAEPVVALTGVMAKHLTDHFALEPPCCGPEIYGRLSNDGCVVGIPTSRFRR